MTLKHLIEQDQRLTILRFLSEQSDYSLNASMLQDAMAAMAHKISRDKVVAHIAWLEEQSLVTSKRVFENVVIATITDRGLDVAKGNTDHPGVKRPRPSQLRE